MHHAIMPMAWEVGRHMVSSVSPCRVLAWRSQSPRCSCVTPVVMKLSTRATPCTIGVNVKQIRAAGARPDVITFRTHYALTKTKHPVTLGALQLDHTNRRNCLPNVTTRMATCRTGYMFTGIERNNVTHQMPDPKRALMAASSCSRWLAPCSFMAAMPRSDLIFCRLMSCCPESCIMSPCNSM